MASTEFPMASAPGLTRPASARARMPIDIRLALGFLVLVVVVALLADQLAPYDYAAQNLAKRLRPPALLGGDWVNPLGTDNLGRDVLSRLIYGVRTSILIALGGTLIGAVVGTLLGLIAACFRGSVDEAIMMLVDVQAAVPYIIVALAFLAFFGNALLLFVVLVGLEGWERYARLTRGLVLAAEEAGYVGAVGALGASTLRLYGRHILPNISAALVVQATINFPGTILLETSLSFLGLGVQPPMTSLGLMLGQGRNFLLQAWWIAIIPGVTIFLTTLSMSLFGDWLRDRLDPTLDGRG